ncbi:MAG: nucleotidyltransferase domain-containing protein [Nanoarchaeota archaeon]|nr:nucleotidyltransferase domain-containing protein [Nanoarchaeota archaeon]MBU1604295.1 nucleotidyltransferase domain-containing protein [Nanoarchaeota archaeon]MBU2442850.1 nucleotidyltransferase domain-containing protein [Nanoarchaeota archaeon]
MISKFIKQNREELLHLFTEKELEIILKQVKGVKMSQADLNRLSREIRPKFAIIRRINLVDEQFFPLKKGCEIEFKIRELIKTILSSKYEEQISRIIVFGSYADRTNKSDSDIDIAVSLPKLNKKQATEFLLWANTIKDEELDISIYELLDKKFRQEADNGRVLYENKR